MPDPRRISASLSQLLTACADAFQSIEASLWARMEALKEGGRESSDQYDRFFRAHDLVEDIRIVVGWAADPACVGGVPDCISQLTVGYEQRRTDGKPGRRLRFDNTLAALRAVREAAQAHAERTSTPLQDRAAILVFLEALEVVDAKVPDVRFPA